MSRRLTLAFALLAATSGVTAAETSNPRLPAQAAQPDWNWADASSGVSQTPEFAASRAICGQLRDLDPPASDWPDAEMSATLADCSSANLYYGIGVPADPIRARRCALLETRRPDGNAGPFTGIGMLMTIYANGRGAARDLDLATSLACRIQGASAEVDGRVTHLQRLKTDQNDGGDFDYCDDITSGMAAGLCAARDAGIDNMARWDRLDRATAGWSEPERRAFMPLRAAAQAYAEASSENEVDLSGTARAALVIEQEQRLIQDFMDLLDTLEDGKLPTASAGAFQAADAELNDIYRQIMASRTDPDERGVYGSDDSLPFTTVTRQGIRTAQRAWLPYRDAWVAFATVKYPQVGTDSLRAVLTRQRIGELGDFLPHGPQ